MEPIVLEQNPQPLSRNEIAVLRYLLRKPEASFEELSEKLGLPTTTISSVAELLKSRNFVEVLEETKVFARSSEEGLEYVDKGLPEEQVAKYLLSQGGSVSIDEIRQSLPENIVSLGVGWARRRGWIKIRDKTVVLERFEPLEKHRELLARFREVREVGPELLNDPVFQELIKRRLIVIDRRKVRRLKLNVSKMDEIVKLVERGEAVSYLTHELLVSGKWRQVVLKPYNVEALPPVVFPGKKHFFKEMIEVIRDVMYALGFEEIRDDYIVPELWNYDALFQAQDHPSRDIHDVLFIEGRADLTMFRDVVERAKQVHESGGRCGSTGWGYVWSLDKASKLLLRSHTTAVTIKYLAKRNTPPVRAFTIGRVFRRDNIDAKHLPEFTNFDGIVMEKDFTFRKLLGILTQILNAIGIKKVMFVPSYFPFTEPSVEGYAYIEGFGWIEVFGAGMFRPEVLEIVNVRHPVGAWGMGVERLAMALLGLEDIRDLYSKDVSYLRRFNTYRAKVTMFRGR